MSDFANQFNKDREEASKGKSEWYKFQEGDNKIRILETPVKFFEAYKPSLGYIQLWHDCGIQGSMKYLTRIWVYKKDKDGQDASFAALTKIPYKVMEQIVSLMTSDDYQFSAFPMPYDINIRAVGAGSKEVSYSVVAARNNTDVPEQATASLVDQTKLETILEKMKEKSKKKWEDSQNKSIDIDTVEYPDEDINPNDIPF